MNLQEATQKILQNKLNETITDDLLEANEKLKHLKNSQELIDLVENYLQDNLGIGYPIYLVGKQGRWMLSSGEVVDENKAQFLVSDYVSKKIIDIRNVYKYYEFSDKCR